MLEWKEEYTTGIDEIDEQHRTLFQYINDLEEIIKEKRTAGYVRLILEYLENYSNSHFSYEEVCMKKHHCPVAASNKVAHQQFLETFHSFQRRFETENESEELLQDIHHMMHDWLLNHICKIDVHLKACHDETSSFQSTESLESLF